MVILRIAKWFWLSKAAIGVFFRSDHFVPKRTYPFLKVKFRLENAFLGRKNFPTRFELYRVPVRTYLRRESFKCDS